MSSITVTHYTKGGAPRYRAAEERFSTLEALNDMFNRLRSGADTRTSGFNYGLVMYTGPEANPTGSDVAIYGGTSTQLQDFLIRAPKWFEKGEDYGSAAHQRFLRRTLLEAIRHPLSEQEMEVALAMPEDQFLAALAIAIDNGESVAELFR